MAAEEPVTRKAEVQPGRKQGSTHLWYSKRAELLCSLDLSLHRQGRHGSSQHPLTCSPGPGKVLRSTFPHSEQRHSTSSSLEWYQGTGPGPQTSEDCP